MTVVPCQTQLDELVIDRTLPCALPLGAVDRAMRTVDLGLRGMGYPGFETQLLLWLSGRLDATSLQKAIDRLTLAEPIIVSRLEEEPNAVPCWRPSGHGAKLAVSTIEKDTSDAVFAYAAEQLGRPADPAAHDPIRFHLLRRPRSADVFLMHYNHTLLDHRGSVGIVRRIARLAGGQEISPLYSPGDAVRRHLLRFPVKRRRAAARCALDIWWQCIRGGAATLGRPNGASPSAPRFRVLGRRLDAPQTESFQASALAACGLPATSMSILARTFRALDDLAGARNHRRGWTAGIGVDLGLRRTGGSDLFNLMSIVPLRAQRDELGDACALANRLNDQLRRHLACEVDLGILQLISTIMRQPHRLRWAVDHCLAHGFSLWYAYFGALDVLGREFLGVPIDDVSYIGPCWSPMGITLLAQQYQGRLSMQVTYVPDLVAEHDAQAFLDRLAAEMGNT
jgi:hypothetical protein